MTMDSLSQLLNEELRDLFSAESQIMKALPKMAKKASCDNLKQAFTNHLKETEFQVKRLERIAKTLSLKLGGKTCKAMEGLIEEGKELLEEEGNPSVIDAALIAAAQRVEHYEMAAYGSARAMAKTLGHDDIVQLLQQTLDEEGAADKKLTKISESEVLISANAQDAEAGMAS